MNDYLSVRPNFTRSGNVEVVGSWIFYDDDSPLQNKRDHVLFKAPFRWTNQRAGACRDVWLADEIFVLAEKLLVLICKWDVMMRGLVHKQRSLWFHISSGFTVSRERTMREWQWLEFYVWQRTNRRKAGGSFTTTNTQTKDLNAKDIKIQKQSNSWHPKKLSKRVCWQTPWSYTREEIKMKTLENSVLFSSSDELNGNTGGGIMIINDLVTGALEIENIAPVQEVNKSVSHNFCSLKYWSVLV